MYKLLLLLLLLGGLLLLGYQIALLFHLSAALHTHAQMRIKAKVYFGRPRTVLITPFSSSRGLADSRAPRPSAGNFLRPCKSSWWFCACVELVRPYSSVAEYTLNAARDGTDKTRKVKYTRAFRLEVFTGPKIRTRILFESGTQTRVDPRNVLNVLPGPDADPTIIRKLDPNPAGKTQTRLYPSRSAHIAQQMLLSQ